MTSITSLAATPEILDNILGYLPKPDVNNVGLTCKALLPASLHSLWGTLELLYQDPYVTKWYSGTKPEKNIWHMIEWHTVEKYWVPSPWLHYTTYIKFDRYLNSDTRVSRAVLELLESGKICPNRVELTVDTPSAEKQLERLKKYSESRELVDFSIYLDSTFQMTKFADLHKITRLTLHRSPPVSESSFESKAEFESWLKGYIEEFAEIIRQTPNLTHFTWQKGENEPECRKYELSVVSNQLQNLQDAFSSLRYLWNLKIDGYIFHPSFFLVPPPSIRRLEVLGCVSSVWWRSFATCPLLGLEAVFLRTCQDWEELRGFADLDQEPAFKDIRLGGVAVRSLRKAFVVLYNNPPDVIQCLVQRNENIDSHAKRAAQFARARQIMQESLGIFDEGFGKCKTAVTNAYIQNHRTGHQPESNSQAWARFGELMIRHARGDFPEESLFSGRDTLNIANQSRELLLRYLDDCIDEITSDQSKKISGGDEGLTEMQFMERCVAGLRSRTRALKDEIEGLSYSVESFARQFDRKLRGMESTIKQTVLDKLVAGDELTPEIVLDMWVQVVMDETASGTPARTLENDLRGMPWDSPISGDIMVDTLADTSRHLPRYHM
ncbi:hypothetical protein TWF506_005463 [Arthrobotrys conoides]|uniref:F-box domain-containing protein n=1 Tax=Arthrobotrys conoides TaxID=74498 RepID=A0AAN8PPT2_9PEZI